MGNGKGRVNVGFLLFVLSLRGFGLSLLTFASQLGLVDSDQVRDAVSVFALDLLLCASCLQGKPGQRRPPVSIAAYRKLKEARNQSV